MIRAGDAAEDVGEAREIARASRLQIGERFLDLADAVDRRRVISLETEPPENGHG